MNHNLIVYYDGACPKCVRDKRNYEKLAGKAGAHICWLDVTGKCIAGSAAVGEYDISRQLPSQFHLVLYSLNSSHP